MITKVTPLQRPGRTQPLEVDPILRNSGAISAIFAELKERLEEGVLSKRHGRLILDIRLDPNGVQTYDLIGGQTRRVS
jgi:hypothetical protein